MAVRARRAAPGSPSPACSRWNRTTSPPLDHWADALHEHRDRAIELTGPDTYNAYLWYLTGCADHARCGRIDVVQFTCTKPGTPQ
ncbi:class I SAM-dependent methyltransferase [Nocardia sp. NPDC005998]|uniref:class I SAM-dependent methyltransferase n=1 Tax=Nocardia sp. NPDC005998 TaxID=3156894 RepID=UPI0033B5F910